MLETFKVPKKEQVRISETSLRRSVTAFFEKMGESSEDAAIAADTLVTSDLRGVESHGVSNMLRYYREGYENEKIKARPNWHIVRETPGTANIDADSGLVVFLGRHAMQIAIEKAKKVGVGAVTVFNSEHSGAIGPSCNGRCSTGYGWPRYDISQRSCGADLCLESASRDKSNCGCGPRS